MASEMDLGFLLDTVGDRDQDPAKKTEILQLKEVSSPPSTFSPKEQLKKYRDELYEKELNKKRDSKPFLSSGLTDPLPNPFANIIKNIEQPLKKNEPLLKGASSSKLSLEAQKALQKSIVTPEFEKLKTIPPYEVSKRKLQQERKKEREKTKGKGWFGLPATEMTDEVKQDLEILQMRSVLDPKHFYKKNDLKVIPKYFQVGKVMDSPLDFYNSRLTKKERKKTLVDELLADAEFQQYNKRKFKEIMEEKQKTHYKSWRKAKSLKKKKEMI